MHEPSETPVGTNLPPCLGRPARCSIRPVLCNFGGIPYTRAMRYAGLHRTGKWLCTAAPGPTCKQPRPRDPATPQPRDPATPQRMVVRSSLPVIELGGPCTGCVCVARRPHRHPPAATVRHKPRIICKFSSMMTRATHGAHAASPGVRCLDALALIQIFMGEEPGLLPCITLHTMCIAGVSPGWCRGWGWGGGRVGGGGQCMHAALAAPGSGACRRATLVHSMWGRGVPMRDALVRAPCPSASSVHQCNCRRCSGVPAAGHRCTCTDGRTTCACLPPRSAQAAQGRVLMLRAWW